MKSVTKIINYEYQMNKSSLLYTLFFSSILFLFFLYKINGNNIENLSVWGTNFAGGMIISMSSVFTLLSYPELKSYFLRQNYLLLPIHNYTKFLTRQIITLILVPLAISLLFLVLQTAIGTVSPWPEGNQKHLIQSIPLTSFIFSWIFIHALCNLLANLYKRRILLKAFVTLYALLSFLPGILILSYNTLIEKEINNEIISSIFEFIALITPIPIYIIVFYLFKKRQI